MKNTLVLLIPVLLLTSCLSAGSYTALKPEEHWGTIDEFAYDGLNAFMFNDLLKQLDQTDVQLSVRPKENVIALYYRDYLGLNCVRINNRNRISLMDLIDKYVQWNGTALQNGDTLERDIGLFKYGLSWEMGDEWYSESYAEETSTGRVSFFSQSSRRHQMVITFAKSHSLSNEYITRKPGQLYFDLEQAVNLRDKIALKYIGNKITAKSLEIEQNSSKYK